MISWTELQANWIETNKTRSECMLMKLQKKNLVSTNTYLLNWISLTETSRAFSIHTMVYCQQHRQSYFSWLYRLSVRVSVWLSTSFFSVCFFFRSCRAFSSSSYVILHFLHSKRFNIFNSSGFEKFIREFHAIDRSQQTDLIFGYF